MGTSENTLGFVACASDTACLNRILLSSECLKRKKYYQSIYFGVQSAAAAFNAEMEKQPQFDWLVWVHQDVVLPAGWDEMFTEKIVQAKEKFPRLAVVGVYGVDSYGGCFRRAGHVLDRGRELSEPAGLPCRVNSLDEMLLAVRTDCGLRFDPTLGFDFYATDIALMARKQGLDVAVVDSYCEHWSTTSKKDNSELLAKRVIKSAEVFERKWHKLFPLETPCFSIAEIGDVARQCEAHLL